MKKTICRLMLLLAVCAAFASCSKEDENKFEITNASGVNFYDCKVWFRNTIDGELTTYESVGNILINQSVKVKKHGNYFYISGKNANGKTLMSTDLRVSDGVNIYKKDLLAY